MLWRSSDFEINMDLEATQLIDDSSSSLNDTVPGNEPVATLIVAGKSYNLVHGENNIGRSPSCQIFLEDPTVSKLHATIHVEHEGMHYFLSPILQLLISLVFNFSVVTITDNRSTNKTRRNQLVLQPHVRYALENGNNITCGDVKMQFFLKIEKENLDADNFLVPETPSTSTPQVAKMRSRRREELSEEAILNMETQNNNEDILDLETQAVDDSADNASEIMSLETQAVGTNPAENESELLAMETQAINATEILGLETQAITPANENATEMFALETQPVDEEAGADSENELLMMETQAVNETVFDSSDRTKGSQKMDIDESIFDQATQVSTHPNLAENVTTDDMKNTNSDLEDVDESIFDQATQMSLDESNLTTNVAADKDDTKDTDVGLESIDESIFDQATQQTDRDGGNESDSSIDLIPSSQEETQMIRPFWSKQPSLSTVQEEQPQPGTSTNSASKEMATEDDSKGQENEEDEENDASSCVLEDSFDLLATTQSLAGSEGEDDDGEEEEEEETLQSAVQKELSAEVTSAENERESGSNHNGSYYIEADEDRLDFDLDDVPEEGNDQSEISAPSSSKTEEIPQNRKSENDDKKIVNEESISNVSKDAAESVTVKDNQEVIASTSKDIRQIITSTPSKVTQEHQPLKKEKKEDSTLSPKVMLKRLSTAKKDTPPAPEEPTSLRRSSRVKRPSTRLSDISTSPKKSARLSRSATKRTEEKSAQNSSAKEASKASNSRKATKSNTAIEKRQTGALNVDEAKEIKPETTVASRPRSRRNSKTLQPPEKGKAEKKDRNKVNEENQESIASTSKDMSSGPKKSVRLSRNATKKAEEIKAEKSTDDVAGHAASSQERKAAKKSTKETKMNNVKETRRTKAIDEDDEENKPGTSVAARRSNVKSSKILQSAKRAEPKKTTSMGEEKSPSDNLTSASRRKTAIHMKPAVMFTGYENLTDHKLVKELGGTVTQQVTDCTVLVTEQLRRTTKLMCAFGRGIPIVSPQWLKQSKITKTFLGI